MASSSAGHATTTAPDATDVSERLASMSVRDESSQRRSLELTPSIKQEDASDAESNSNNATTPQTHSRSSSAAPKLDGYAFRDSFMNSSTLGLSQTGVLERYDISSEKEHLKLPFYSESFQSDLNLTRNILQDLQQQIADASENNEDFRDMPDKIKDLCDKTRATYTIGIVGGEQSGKSSLINSLLHIPDISPVGGIERHITNVITEYHYAEEGQISPIVIVSEAMSQSEVEAELSLLVDVLHSDDPSVREATADYIRDIFFGNGLFTIFQDATVQKIVETVTAEQLLQYWKRDGPEWNTHRGEFDDPRTAHHISSIKSFRKWPWIKTIKYFVHAEILKDGLVIAEVPIFRQYNAPVLGRHISNYLRDCNTIFLTTTILEATATISTCKKRLNAMGYDKVQVICTKSDQLSVKEMRQLALKSTKHGHQRELERLEEQMNIQQAQRNQAELELAKQRQMEFLFKVRDEFLRQKIEAWPLGFGSFTMSVSNTKYDKYCEKGPHRRVADTRIPTLRYHCRKLVADATLDAYKNTILPWAIDTINDIKSHVPQESTIQEEIELTQLTEAMDHCQNIKDKIMNWVQFTRSKCCAKIHNSTLRFTGDRTSVWAAHALKVGKRWQSQYMSSENFDNTTDYETWNSSFLEGLEQPALIALFFNFEINFELEILDLHRKLWSNIQAVLEKIRVIKLNVSLSQMSAYPAVVRSMFQDRIHAAKEAVEQVYEKTITASKGSYIWDIMTPTYDSAFELSMLAVPRDVSEQTVLAYVRRQSPCARVLSTVVRDLSYFFACEQNLMETTCYGSLIFLQSIIQEGLNTTYLNTRLTHNFDEKLAKLKEIAERINTTASSQSEGE